MLSAGHCIGIWQTIDQVKTQSGNLANIYNVFTFDRMVNCVTKQDLLIIFRI